jgi:antitoxin MazE
MPRPSDSPKRLEARIIPIGNSRGLRLPKALLERYGFGERVALVALEEGLLLRPLPTARAGWDEAFARMRELGDDAPLIDDRLDLDAWDFEEPHQKAP